MTLSDRIESWVVHRLFGHVFDEEGADLRCRYCGIEAVRITLPPTPESPQATVVRVIPDELDDDVDLSDLDPEELVDR